jgi:hypothetical protein
MWKERTDDKGRRSQVWDGALPGDEVEILHVDIYGIDYWLPWYNVGTHKISFDAAFRNEGKARREAIQGYRAQVAYNNS